MLSALPVECPTALMARAKRHTPMRLAVVNATTPTVLESAKAAFDEGLIEPILVGAPLDIGKACDSINWDVSNFQIEFAGDEQQSAAVACAMAGRGEVAGLMKGDVHTDVLMRAVLNRHAGLRTDRLMSHVFHMTVPGNDTALCITDAVLNVLPTLEQKVQILENAITLMAALGYTQPKVALLSAAETEMRSMPSTRDAAILTRRAELGGFGDAVIEGPLAFDLAVSKQAANIKGVEGAVAGNADLLLVPNIETGNALFKMMVLFMSAAAAGVILGAKVPIVLTSRADPVAARLASVALAVIYANRDSSSLQPNTAHD